MINEKQIATRLYHSREWLQEMYVNQKMSTPQIANLCATDHQRVLYWLNKHGINTRTSGEGVHLRSGRHLKRFPLELHQFLDGSLLGDGCLHKHNAPSAFYNQSSKFKSYVTWIRDKFAKWGVDVSVPRLITKTNYVRNYLFSLTYVVVSKSYADFRAEYERWYPEGIKIVPRDLQLSPLLVRKWMLDDGYRYPGKWRIVLCTHGFIKDDVMFLQEKLGEIDIPTSLWESKRGSNQWSIAINKPGYDAFFDYIGCQAPVPEMAYKFPKKNKR